MIQLKKKNFDDMRQMDRIEYILKLEGIINSTNNPIPFYLPCFALVLASIFTVGSFTIGSTYGDNFFLFNFHMGQYGLAFSAIFGIAYLGMGIHLNRKRGKLLKQLEEDYFKIETKVKK